MPSVAEAEKLQAAVGDAGVLISDFGGGRLRMVTHYGITANDCRRALAVIEKCWVHGCAVSDVRGRAIRARPYARSENT